MPKRNRKEQLAEARRAKQERREEREQGADFVPNPDDDVDDNLLGPVEDVGQAAARADAAYRQRRSRERFVGLGAMTSAMHAWLMTSEGAQSQACAAVVSRCVSAAVESVLDLAKQARLVRERAEQASAKRVFRAERKRKRELELTPTSFRRAGRTFGRATPSSKTPRPSSATPKPRTRKPARTLTLAMMSTLARITKARAFRRDNVRGVENMSRKEWAHVRTDHLGLRRVHALHRYVTLRHAGTAAREAYEDAARMVVMPSGKAVNWQTVRGWLKQFIRDGGKLAIDGRGGAPSTNTFLADPQTKEKTLFWLREQLKLTR